MELVELIYNKVLDKPRQILEIFNNFFGSNRVDMQGFKTLDEVKAYFSKKDAITKENISAFVGMGFILVHFPEVTITNENNKSVNIRDLWAKVWITNKGLMNGRFLLNRSSYEVTHLDCNYMHSHVRNIPFTNFEEFQNPCTGSGPINHTIGSLNANYDADLWNLFCLELSKYVTVESLAGIPYHKLEGLRSRRTYHEDLFDCPTKFLSSWEFSTDFTPNKLAAFTAYLIKNVEIPFNYINSSYSIAESPVNFILRISDLFIHWYNSMYKKGYVTDNVEGLLCNGIIKECILSDNNLYAQGSNDSTFNRYRNYVGRKVCTFKGKDITINISGLHDNLRNTLYILNPRIVSYIVTKILNTVNYKYGREELKEGNIPSEKVTYL